MSMLYNSGDGCCLLSVKISIHYGKGYFSVSAGLKYILEVTKVLHFWCILTEAIEFWSPFSIRYAVFRSRLYLYECLISRRRLVFRNDVSRAYSRSIWWLNFHASMEQWHPRNCIIEFHDKCQKIISLCAIMNIDPVKHPKLIFTVLYSINWIES